jgi:hypothetical protein
LDFYAGLSCRTGTFNTNLIAWGDQNEALVSHLSPTPPPSTLRVIDVTQMLLLLLTPIPLLPGLLVWGFLLSTLMLIPFFHVYKGIHAGLHFSAYGGINNSSFSNLFMQEDEFATHQFLQ